MVTRNVSSTACMKGRKTFDFRERHTLPPRLTIMEFVKMTSEKIKWTVTILILELVLSCSFSRGGRVWFEKKKLGDNTPNIQMH